MDPELVRLTLQLLPTLLGILAVPFAALAASWLVRRLLDRADVPQPGDGVQWRLLLSGLVGWLVLTGGIGLWVTEATLVALVLPFAALLLRLIAVAALGMGYTAYATVRRRSARPDEDVETELGWGRAGASAAGVLVLADLGGFMMLMLVALGLGFWVSTDPKRRQAVSATWDRFKAGNTLRNNLSDGNTVTVKGRKLTVLGTPGLLSTDLLGDEGLVTLDNRELLVAALVKR